MVGSLDQRGGGPVFEGIRYQTAYGVRVALDLIRQQYQRPYESYSLTLEAPIVDESHVERWDLRVLPSGDVYEMKTHLRAEGVNEFAVRVATSVAPRHWLVHESGSPATLDRLLDVWKKAPDEETFRRWIPSSKQARSTERLLELFGDDAYVRLGRVGREQISLHGLQQIACGLAQQLAGDSANELIWLIRDTLEEAAIAGRRVGADELIELAREHRIEVEPPHSDTVGMSDHARAIALVLDRFEVPLPVGVFHRLCGLDEEGLQAEIDALADPTLIRLEEGMAVLRPTPTRFVDRREHDLLGTALSAVLDHVDETSRAMRPIASELVDAICRISHELRHQVPHVVAHVFRVLEKPLKARGNRRLVYEIAERSIHAEGRVSDEHRHEVLESSMITIVSGRAWCYQRWPECLAKARLDLEANLETARGHDLPLVEALAWKGLGRQFRLEAPEKQKEAEQWYRRSVECLERALPIFAELQEHEQLGDTHSLLARTHLQRGDLKAAREAVRRAAKFLHDAMSKEYFDLWILKGDIALASGHYTDAINAYNRVINDPNAAGLGEVVARALHQRGKAWERRRAAHTAVSDYQLAAEIYWKLSEGDWASRSEIEAMRLRGQIPSQPSVRSWFCAESTLVQVLAIRHHLRAVDARLVTGAIAARAGEERHWREMVEAARKEGAKWRRTE